VCTLSLGLLLRQGTRNNNQVAAKMIERIRRINKRTVNSAGPRYTPGIDADSPNLEIGELLNAMNGLAVNEQFKSRVLQVLDEFEKAMSECVSALDGKKRAERYSNRVSKLIKEMSEQPVDEGRVIVQKIIRAADRIGEILGSEITQVNEKIDKRKAEIDREKTNSAGGKTPDREDRVLESLRSRSSQLYRTSSEVRYLKEFFDSSEIRLRFGQVAMLTGEWGTGKTHFLCDLAKRFTANGAPSLVVLAKDFDPAGSCGDELAKFTGLANSFDDLIQIIDRMGQEAGYRGLILIDGINESDPVAWKRDVPKLITAVKGYSHVGLVVSCREPFDRTIVPDSSRKRMVHLKHVGFYDIEFDAQREFFNFYGIPLPEVPLLADEFSRPLTLKILCQAYQSLPRKDQRKGFHGISSGQKGMTFILEHFVFERTKAIEREMGLPAKFCWDALKGKKSINDPELSGLASYMGHHLTEWVPYKKTLEIFRARPEISSLHRAKLLLRLLVREGVLVENQLWRPDDDGGSLHVVGMPYQRFSDHIVARYLLREHLNTRDANSIRRSFYANQPLGKIFRVSSEFYPRFDTENWAEAIILEFPEYTKKCLPQDARELFFYLPKRARDFQAYFDPFIRGLIWRSPFSISKQTDQVLGGYFWSSHDTWQRAASEALVSMATKPRHPYCGMRLMRNLARVSMQRRDCTWSEYIRYHHDSGSAVERIVAFYESGLINNLKFDTAINVVAVLSSFLTTTDRRLRDRATKALVLVGELQPRALFDFMHVTLDIDDPYVRERVLAACFGVAMSKYAIRPGKRFGGYLVTLAKWLVKEWFLPGGRAHTHHVLMRDYALGIIELAQKFDPSLVPRGCKRYLKAPYPAIDNPFPNPSAISGSIKEKTKRVMMMDFENYTLGRLIPDRSNYDMKHPIYQDVRNQIEWRVIELGYDEKVFSDIDSMIGRINWRREGGDKVDRYGKKYCWIAYFEMYGYRQAHKLIDDGFERSSDCDIDPSFPVPEKFPLPTYQRTIGSETHHYSPLGWLQNGPIPSYDSILEVPAIGGHRGPWVLVDGDIWEEDESSGLSIFTVIRALGIRPEESERFSAAFINATNAGGELPDVRGDHYAYAGEVGWSKRFAAEMRTHSGKLVNPMHRLFGSHQRFKTKIRLRKTWFLFDYSVLLKYHRARTETGREKALSLVIRELERVNQEVPRDQRLSLYEILHQVPALKELKSGYQDNEGWRTVNSIEAESFRWPFSWESYHSTVNDYSGFTFPSPWLCDSESLVSFGRSINLRDKNGRLATLYLSEGENWRNRVDFLFIRKSVLANYLQKRGLELSVVIWGERRVDHDSIKQADQRAEIEKSYQAAIQEFKYVA